MTLSATNFREPVLRVLAEMSEYTAGVAVKGKDTYADVMAIMGIASIDVHGMNESSGQPMVYKWIQWANTSLRDRGLTSNPGRGKWALTPSGLVEAKALQQKAGVTVPVAAVPAPAVAAVAAVAAVPTLDATVGISLQIGSVASRGLTYSPDAYIRSLAIATTGCFGKFSPHGSATCNNCPLQTECRNAQAANLSTLAGRLAAEDRASLAPKTPATAPQAALASKATAAAHAAPKTKDVSGIDFSTADIIKCRMDLSCEKCGTMVKEGDKCRWVESINDDDDSGVFHLDCSGGQP